MVYKLAAISLTGLLLSSISVLFLFGSTQHFSRYLAGEKVFFSPEKIKLPPSPGTGQTTPVTLELHNFTNSEVHIKEWFASCSCIGIDCFPATIPAWGNMKVNVMIKRFDDESGITSLLKVNAHGEYLFSTKVEFVF